MSGNDEFDDSTVDEEVKASEGWKNLRAARDKLAKDLADARTELAGVKTERRTNSLADLLKSKNVSEKVAKFFPGDVEVNDESVTKWLGENADVFGPSPVALEGQQKVDTPVIEQARKVAQAAANSPGTPPVGLDQISSQLKALDSKSPTFMEDLTNVMGSYSP